MNPKAITFKGDEIPSIYICENCTRWHTTKIYACTHEMAAEAARQSAEKCCMPNVCECGEEITGPFTACRSCRKRNMLRKAQRVTDYDGPVCSDDVGGSWGEGYSGSVDEMIEYCRDNGEPIPTYCHPCTAYPLRLDAERILESAIEEQHEAACDQIEAADELEAFIGQWNAKQHCVTYFEDKSRVIVLDEARFQELMQ